MLTLFILLISISSPLSAKVVELSKGESYLRLDADPKWELKKDLFGMPFIFFSPQENGQRSNISLTDTDVDISLRFKELSDNQDVYQVEKRKWADKVGADIISYSRLTKWTNKNGHKVFQIGAQYNFENKIYVETSYYLNCLGKIIFSKSLRLLDNDTHQEKFKEIVDSLTCERVK